MQQDTKPSASAPDIKSIQTVQGVQFGLIGKKCSQIVAIADLIQSARSDELESSSINLIGCLIEDFGNEILEIVDDMLDLIKKAADHAN